MALFCRQLLPDCVWVDSYAFCHLRPMKRQESVGTGAELRLPGACPMAVPRPNRIAAALEAQLGVGWPLR